MSAQSLCAIGLLIGHTTSAKIEIFPNVHNEVTSEIAEFILGSLKLFWFVGENSGQSHINGGHNWLEMALSMCAQLVWAKLITALSRDE